MDDLTSLQQRAEAELADAPDEAGLEAWRLRYLSRKGLVSQAVERVSSLLAVDRPAYGMAANQLKQVIQAAFEARVQTLREASLAAELTAEGIDVTLPGRRPLVGRMHPTSRTLRDIYSIFAHMGFQIYNGVDVETRSEQLPVAQHARRPSGSRHVGHLLHDDARRPPPHAHQPRPDSRHARAGATTRSASFCPANVTGTSRSLPGRR